MFFVCHKNFLICVGLCSCVYMYMYMHIHAYIKKVGEYVCFFTKGNNCLVFACHHQHVSIAVLLIAAGAEVQHTDIRYIQYNCTCILIEIINNPMTLFKHSIVCCDAVCEMTGKK